jgi:hypothetical protein
MKTVESTSKRFSGSATTWSADVRQNRQPTNIPTRDRSDDPRWSLVERIVASHSLRRSTLLANFLRFVCDRSLEGKTSEINERQIGFHVFGRMEGYNANDDNIVRSYARTLRKRLEEYFTTEGKHEDLLLFIPRGGYLPVFSPKNSETAAPEQSVSHSISAQISTITANPLSSIASGNATDSSYLRAIPQIEVASDALYADTVDNLGLRSKASAAAQLAEPSTTEEDEDTKQTFRWRPRHWYVLATACSIVLSVMAGYVAGTQRWRNTWYPLENEAARVNRVFWSGLFEEKRDTFIVPADGGLVMLQSFVKEHVSLEDYANGNYRKESQIAQGMVGLTRNTNDAARIVHKVEVIGKRRYTSIADLELTAHLSRLPEVFPERLMIRYARDLRIDDLRTGNAVLIGSIDANPWVDLFQQQLNFRFSHGAEFGGSGIITNQHPLPGERTVFASEPNDPLHRTYGVIAYVPSLDGVGHVLIIEGVNMAGTQAAGEFLLAPDQMQSVLKRVMGPKGVIRPFEILIETDNIAANASRPHVLSERVNSH